MGGMTDLKQTERLFIAMRWAAVPVLLILGWLHPPLPMPATLAMTAGLATANVLVWQANRRIKRPGAQLLLGAGMLALDALIASTAIAFFIADRSTAAYAGFALVVIEAAVRYALVGGLAMAAVFALGLAVAMVARWDLYAVTFSVPGYAFWVLFMVMLGLAVGALVRQSRERQHEVRRLSGEQARLAERHRLSRELHDTLLKTLHGLSLEAHSLRAPLSSNAMEAKARYIEEVCAKAAVDIRGLIFDLRQNAAEPFGEQVERIVYDWAVRTGTEAEVRWEGEDVVLPAKLDHDLRQALEEALLNVERHAGATEAWVSVRAGAELF